MPALIFHSQETKPAGHGYRTIPARLRVKDASDGDREVKLIDGCATEGYQLGRSRGDAARCQR